MGTETLQKLANVYKSALLEKNTQFKCPYRSKLGFFAISPYRALFPKMTNGIETIAAYFEEKSNKQSIESENGQDIATIQDDFEKIAQNAKQKRTRSCEIGAAIIMGIFTVIPVLPALVALTTALALLAAATMIVLAPVAFLVAGLIDAGKLVAQKASCCAGNSDEINENLTNFFLGSKNE